MRLEKEVKKLLAKGVHDPNELFKLLYKEHPVHYSKIREAIHNAKQK